MLLKIKNRIVNTKYITSLDTYDDFETYGRESENDITYGITINLVNGKTVKIGFNNSREYNGLAQRDAVYSKLIKVLNVVYLDHL